MTKLLFPRQDPQDGAWADFKMWYYAPSIPAAAVFTALFSILTAYHAYLIFRRRTWFCVPFIVGGALEIIGYLCRALAHDKLDNIALYTVQYLSLLVAPILFAASIYMILARIILAVHGEKYSLIRITWLTKIFVGGDVICFATQMAGGGMLAGANTKPQIDTANNIVLGGLILQIVIFGLFIVAAVLFQQRLSRAPTDSSIIGPLGEQSNVGGFRGWVPARNLPGWKRLMIGLYVTSALITIRNVVRVIEYGMGWNSYLFVNEWTIYVFDGTLMIFVLIVCVMWYDPAISKEKHSRKQLPADEMACLENGDTASATKERVHTQGENVGPWS